MKSILILLNFLFFISANANANDLDDLKTKYNNAIVAKAIPTDRIKGIYISELQKLLTKATIINDTALTVDVSGELKRMSIDVTTPKKDEDITHYFLNKVWVSDAKVEYHFQKDSKGFRLAGTVKTIFSWRLVDANIVEISGRFYPNSPPKVWYFKFFTKEHGLFGESPNNIVNSIVIKK